MRNKELPCKVMTEFMNAYTVYINCLFRTAVNIMKRFCRDNPVERLGYQKDGISDIRKNRWFQVDKDYNN